MLPVLQLSSDRGAVHQFPGGGAACTGGVHEGGGGGGFLVTAESSTGPQHTEVIAPEWVLGFHPSPRRRKSSWQPTLGSSSPMPSLNPVH